MTERKVSSERVSGEKVREIITDPPKPLDLSYVMRDAFLAGRGLKDGDKLTDADQTAWASYSGQSNAYERLARLDPATVKSMASELLALRSSVKTEALAAASEVTDEMVERGAQALADLEDAPLNNLMMVHAREVLTAALKGDRS